jgi:hypothetical protein
MFPLHRIIFKSLDGGNTTCSSKRETTTGVSR